MATRNAVSAVIGSQLAVPRMPSVPKSFRIIKYPWLWRFSPSPGTVAARRSPVAIFPFSRRPSSTVVGPDGRLSRVGLLRSPSPRSGCGMQAFPNRTRLGEGFDIMDTQDLGTLGRRFETGRQGAG